jgi:hypothetical protein
VKRIDPTQVAAMAQRTGLQPVRGIFLRMSSPLTSPCGCVLGITAADTVGLAEVYRRRSLEIEEEDIVVILARVAGLDRSYAVGLSDGWESTDPNDTMPSERRPSEPITDRDAYDLGFADGSLAARLVRPELFSEIGA